MGHGTHPTIREPTDRGGALEQRRGALVTMLSNYGQLYIYPVHPKALSDFRNAFHPSGSKSDPVDTDLLYEILTKHRERLRRLDPDTESMRLLAVEGRRKLVDDKTALSNRLTDMLKICFPQLLRWFGDVTTALRGDLLTTYPTLMDLQKAKPAALKKFFFQHNCRDENKIQQHIDNIAKAVASTQDPAIVGAAHPMVAVWVEQLAVLRRAIKELDKQIHSQAAQQEDWAIFNSFPGAGDVLAPRLMAAMGTQRDLFQSADDVQCSSGIAPVKKASGNTTVVSFRRACPKFLRQSFHEWAACSIPFSQWARVHYQSQRDSGHDHHEAVRSVAFKWQRILFRCWQDQKPYSEQTHLINLAKKSPEWRLRLSVQNM